MWVSVIVERFSHKRWPKHWDWLLKILHWRLWVPPRKITRCIRTTKWKKRSQKTMDSDSSMQFFKIRRDCIDGQKHRSRHVAKHFTSLSPHSACWSSINDHCIVTSILRCATMPNPCPKIFAGPTPLTWTPCCFAHVMNSSCWAPGGDSSDIGCQNSYLLVQTAHVILHFSIEQELPSYVWSSSWFRTLRIRYIPCSTWTKRFLQFFNFTPLNSVRYHYFCSR